MLSDELDLVPLSRGARGVLYSYFIDIQLIKTFINNLIPRSSKSPDFEGSDLSSRCHSESPAKRGGEESHKAYM